MKKVISSLVIVATFLFSSVAFAAEYKVPSTVDGIKKEITVQQKAYDTNAELAADILSQIIKEKHSFEEVQDLEAKLKEARANYKAAADNLQKLRIALFELTN